MCGIVGFIKFNNDKLDRQTELNLQNSLKAIIKRGPDNSGYFSNNSIWLGHVRLSIIDTSSLANQPFYTSNKKGVLVYNGEIFNYKQLAKKYKIENNLKTNSDTEVLAELLVVAQDVEVLLNELNGFFSFAFYNLETNSLIVARDRYGVKPLYYQLNEQSLLFASELKALNQLNVSKDLDLTALNLYLHLNYIPSPFTIYANVKKLTPGTYLIIDKERKVLQKTYYSIYSEGDNKLTAVSYPEAVLEVKNILASSVEQRLIADVPIGCFLSGGIDSSIITALASGYVDKLNTFSIGFKDNPFFDETAYSRIVAKKYNTQHHEFILTNNDLFDNLFEMLDYLDEPYADSSSLNMYIVCKHTKKTAKVVLSGDGADELFAGYNKYAAELLCRTNQQLKYPLKLFSAVVKRLPQSRNNLWSNKVRQLNKFIDVVNLSYTERYWRLAGFTSISENTLLNKQYFIPTDYTTVFNQLLTDDFNLFLLADQQLVLEGDMLVKVDRMSMANSIEVREPFLDYRLVNYVNKLPASFKIDSKRRKKVLIDAFANKLPSEIINRSKKGFEVPLYSWFNNQLKSLIIEDYLSKSFIEQQGIFNYTEVKKLLDKLFSKNPGDTVARVYGLMVFQHWYRNYYVK